MSNTPNSTFNYVDAITGAILGSCHFFDGLMKLEVDKRTGTWYIQPGYGGTPDKWWIESEIAKLKGRGF